MKRIFMLVVLLCAPVAWATHTCTTCYIASNGSDANSGASTSLPWVHAPGMSAATGNAASQVPVAGDKYIFRGGDTWHYAVNSPNSTNAYIGGSTWSWSWNGSSTNCNLDATAGAVTRTSCVYIGTDHTYFSGGSFVRPIISMDNPLSTGYVASCPNSDEGVNNIFIRASYIQWDDFDFQGNCNVGSSGGGTVITPLDPTIAVTLSMVEFSNNYFHGWTSTVAQGDGAEIGCNGAGCNGFVLIDYNVFDGSDSSGAAVAYSGNQTAAKVCTDWEYNVLRYVGNNCVEDSGKVAPDTTHLFHDNLFEYLYNVGHGNVIEMVSGASGNSSGPVYFYNNMLRHTDEGVTIDIIPNSGGTTYGFNNIFYDIANGSNCYGPNSNIGAGATNNIFNNTFDFAANVQNNTNGGCKVAQASDDTALFRNNHFINYSPAAVSTLCGVGICTDNGTELWQTEAVANGQGYVGCAGAPTCSTGNSYQPTSSGGSTVQAGFNFTTFCNALAVAVAASACNSGSTGGVTVIAGEGGEVVGPTLATANARGSTWDIGAYQFAAGPVPHGGSAQNGVKFSNGAILR